MVLSDVIEKVSDNESDFQCGRHCKFYYVDNVGLKVYRKYDMFHACYTMQQKLSQLALAPRVYGKLAHFYIRGETKSCVRHAYITEVVDHVCKERDSEYFPALEMLTDRLDQHGYEDIDVCDFNYGWLDGTMVALDMGGIRIKNKHSINTTAFGYQMYDSRRFLTM